MSEAVNVAAAVWGRRGWSEGRKFWPYLVLVAAVGVALLNYQGRWRLKIAVGLCVPFWV